MDPVPTRYIDRDGSALAYQVVGSGPVDVVWYFEINMHLDLCWTDPHTHQLFEHGATYSRAAYLQRRGIGLSDPIAYTPSIEQQADDIVAVMDDIGMRRALLVGVLGNCPVLAMVAARAPHRVSGLVLVNPLAQGPSAPHEELVGWTPTEAQRFISGYLSACEHWGSGATLAMWDPAMDTPFNRRLIGMTERCSTTPAAATAYVEWVLGMDVREIMRSVRVPTRVIRVPTNPAPDAAVTHVAELIPGATLHVIPVAKPGSSVGEAWVPIVEHVEEAATGAEHRVDANRFLGTILFTDVVGSTELLAELGDSRYRELRDDHERQVRFEVERAGGRLVKVIGDGTLSVFDGPTTAVRAGEAITESARGLGIEVRAGVHSGELERAGPDVHGMSVHIGARVAALAGPGEVVVSRTVHDLVIGSGLRFVPRGEHDLRGIPGTWELFTLASTGGSGSHAPAESQDLGAFDRAALQTARRAPGMARTAVRLGNAWQRRRAGSR
jgi:class 3 adenylate cyclase/pimeloyl-ACP methyl ester carboxylesterase